MQPTKKLRLEPSVLARPPRTLPMPLGTEPLRSGTTLTTLAWSNVAFALVVVWVFGWTRGKLLVGQSCEDAKMAVADQKAQRAAKKDEERAAEYAG